MESQPTTSGAGCSVTSETPVVSSLPTAPVLPKSSGLRFPVRVGITWKKGERLEAQDFSNTWYPSKIVELSEEEQAVLIHFEGWNQRYDEWVHVASERLRPTTRHSERKDKGINKRRRVHPHPIYRPGDEVLARWKDCKKYPAKINRLIEQSTYEVVFYDGVTHMIQAMNIQPLPEEMKAMKTKLVPPPQKAKLSFKQVKVNLPASIRKQQESRQNRSGQTVSGKILAKSKRSPSKLISKSKLLPKVTLKRDRELDVFSVTGNRYPPSPTKKAHKDPAPVTITCEATLSTLSEEECLKLFGSAAVAGVGSSDGSCAELPGSVAVGPGIGAIDTPKEDAGWNSISEIPKAVPNRGKDSKCGHKASAVRVRRRANTDSSTGAKKRKTALEGSESGVTCDLKAVKKHQVKVLGSGERSKSLDQPGYFIATPAVLPPVAPQYFVPSKAFIVEEDHNPFKCPHEGCTKDFRKESLLQYHIKYYHTEPEISPSATAISHPTAPSPSAVGVSPAEAPCSGFGISSGLPGNSTKPRTDVVNSLALATPPATSLLPLTPSLGTPKRRRRKTDSICSTDSEMSASSKSKSSKRHRNDSEISVTTESPEVAGKESQTDSSRLVQELASADRSLVWPGVEEADEEEMASDMVNCVCGERHHTGLMIQCEVCLCWQHFKCADVKKTGVPPLNYVCLICENSPGSRDSCKYLHDMGWERRGELPTFPFLQQQASGTNPSRRSSTAHLTTLASECNDLLDTLHGIKRALHSTRRQIKISKEEDDPEFQLWQTDWDNWKKPQEDFAPSPTSGDPNLSQTPSAFLFPPTPSSCKEEENQENDTDLGTRKTSTSTFSSQMFSVSATPPKVSAFPRDQTTTTSVGSAQLSTFETPMLATEDGTQVPPLSESLTSSKNTIIAGPSASEDRGQVPLSECAASSTVRPLTTRTCLVATDADSPLTISTTEALSINTGISSATAPSPSSSSLSSLQMSTPPMMLSPSVDPPPSTPSVGRASSVLPSIMTQGIMGSLVRDLFPGPAGDAKAHDLGKPCAQDAGKPLVHNLGIPLDCLSVITSGDLASQSTIKGTGSELSQVKVSSVSAESKTETPPSSGSRESAGISEEQKQKKISENQRDEESSGKDSISGAGFTSASFFGQSKTEGSQNGSQNEVQMPHDDQTLEDLDQKTEPDQDAKQTLPSSSSGLQLEYVGRRNNNAKHQNGGFSPNQDSLYANRNGMAEIHPSFSNEDDEDTHDNDTDTAEESAEPYRNCEQNLLVHVQTVHSDVERQLACLEARVAELEQSEHDNPTVQFSEDNILNDVPALKKSLSKLARYLLKVQHFTS